MKALLRIEPVAKARPRFSKWGAYTPKKTLDFEKLVREEFIKQCKKEINPEYTGSIAVKINFCLSIPKSYSKKKREELIGKPHLKKPDTDNLAKAVLDALNGIAWKDDSQIFFLSILKQYAEEPMIDIDIEYMSEGKNGRNESRKCK